MISNTLEYAKTLIGTKYTLWVGGKTTDKSYPFYVNRIPRRCNIKKYGINCAGLINILRLNTGRKIQGGGPYRGGVLQWYQFLRRRGVLQRFDFHKDYPIGTLFIRKYRNEFNQGHLAILIDKSSSGKKIIHAFGNKYGKGKLCLSSLHDSHYSYPHGYYEYVVMPGNWLV